MERRKPPIEKGYLRIFASYYRPHIRLFILDLFCALLIAGVDLIFPLASRYSMERLLPGNSFTAFFTVMVILIAAYLLKGAFIYIVGYWGHLLGVRMEADIRADLFEHMQTLSYSFYDRNRTGSLMSRMTGDLFEVVELAHHGPEDLFISCVTLVGAFCIMIRIRWELTVAVFAVVPVFVVCTLLQKNSMTRASADVKAKLAVINEGVESAISGMRTAKAFANEEAEHEKFSRANDQYRGAKRGYYKAMSLYLASLEFFMGIMTVLVIALGGWLIMRGRMDYIDLITFSLYVSTFLTPVRKLSSFVEQYVQGMAGFKRFVELMRITPEVDDAPDAAVLENVSGEIRVEDVSFRYEEEKDLVLDHVDLHVRPGETVAVVGPSGGGKSTLCALIPRFYDVTGGRILVDGHDVRAVTQKSLHESVGIVQQDVFLFAGTIRENIRYGRPDATDEEIVEAARRAEIYDDILQMPDGFDTYVGERGVMLSGGQKQRISIARIFLKNPPILILDEATSALDSVTETRIQGAFDALAVGRTTLIIAHRLSTIRNADRILVVDGHRIAEEGTHEELLARGGAYAGLWQAQRRPEENA